MLKKILQYDEITGDFIRLVSSNPNNIGKAGHKASKNGYVRIEVLGKKYLAHRLAWLYVHGNWPSNIIDHIDGCKHNNKISNLRDVSQTTNLENQKTARSNSKSGFLGVIKEKSNKYRAQIVVNKKQVRLGPFDTKEEAASHYLEFKELYHSLKYGD